MSSKLVDGEKRKKEIKNEDLIDLIEGYAFPITTPFGKILSLSGDLLTSGRPLRNIEANIDKFIRPFAGYTYRRVSLGEKARIHAKKSVAELLHLSSETHEIVFLHSNAEMEPVRRITSIILEALTKEKAGSRVQVYLQTNQSYVNVMPWLQYPERIKIIPLESDESGSLGASTIVNAVLKHASKAKFNIVQLQALSSKTKQKLDLQAFQAQIEALRIEYPNSQFACIIDATPLISGSGYSNKEIEDALNFFDFCIIQTSRLLGGSLAASIMICKKSKLASLQVKLSNADLSDEVEPTSVLRASHLLEFYYAQGLPQRIESSQNTQLFFDEVQKVNQRLRETSVLNKIDLGGLQTAATAGRYSVMILNEGSQDFLEEEFKGYPIILAKHLAQILNDLFGIQVKANNMLQSTQYRFRFSDIPIAAITKYGLTPETGNVEMNASTIELDIHFLLTPDEIMYITSALEQIALGSGKLLKYYNKKLLKPKLFIPQQVNISLTACSSFPYVETDISNREEQYATQLYESSRILKQPANYFTIAENWSEEKSTVFPLDALADSFPLKARKTDVVVTKDNDCDSDDSVDSQVQTNDLDKNEAILNFRAVQEARKLILRIQKNGPGTPKDGDQTRTSKDDNRRDSIQPSEEEQPQMSQQYLEQLRAQIRRELRGELREEVEQEIKEKEEKAAAERAAAQKKDAKFAMNEQIQVKEKRLKNLKAIFSFYSTLPDVLEEKKELLDSDQRNNKTPIPFFLRKLGQQETIQKLGLNKFFKFCDDFELISEQLDLKTLYKLFTKVCPHNEITSQKPAKSVYSLQLQAILKNSPAVSTPSTTAGASSAAARKINSKMLNSSDITENINSNKISLAYPGEVDFNQFSLIIEKMAQVFYAKNDNLYTQFDKTDQFHKHLGLDDKQNYKHRMKPEGLVSFSFLFHDKYQIFTQAPPNYKNNSSVNASLIQKPKITGNKQTTLALSELDFLKQAYQSQSNSSLSSQYFSANPQSTNVNTNNSQQDQDIVGDTRIYVSQLNYQNKNNQSTNDQSTLQNSSNVNASRVQTELPQMKSKSKITKNASFNLLPSLTQIPIVPHISMVREVEWRQDQDSMNPKLLYNDPTISQQDILQELTQISQNKKISQQRVSSLPPAQNPKTNVNSSTQQQYASPLKAKSSAKPEFVTPGNNSNTKNVLNSSISNPNHNLISNNNNNNSQFPSIQPSQFQQMNSPKLSGDRGIQSPHIAQADIRQQQAIQRAKQLAILEKEKERDLQRLRGGTEGDSPSSSHHHKNLSKADTSILSIKQSHSPLLFSNALKK